VICSFSAASNVTGIVTDVADVTRRVKQAGARIIWDYAGGGPYLPIAMTPQEGAEIDAIVVSPHKFMGGPGASGVLIIRRDAVLIDKPSWSGGGTVKFVSSTGHDYADSLEAREEAGTPNVIGDIRAALAFLVKDAIGHHHMATRNRALTEQALAVWANHPHIELLGNLSPERLPIFSFRIRDGHGGYLHQQLVTRMLSDRFGIQARGGCACAGPYVHRLLDISEDQSARLRADILAGHEMEKPGFTRLNFSVLLTPDKVDYILQSVSALALDAAQFCKGYAFDPARAIFFPQAA
jgi:selenocysteine lyase/cysteine desulfurase